MILGVLGWCWTGLGCKWVVCGVLGWQSVGLGWFHGPQTEYIYIPV